jgi:anti-sigma B factor antagonist
MRPRLQISEHTVDGVSVLRLKGRMVLGEGDVPLRDCVNELVRRGCNKVVVDMKDVTRLDSAGIGMLVSKFLTVHRHGGVMKLLNLSTRGGHLMRVTRLTTVFEIFDSEDEAVRSFMPGIARE